VTSSSTADCLPKHLMSWIYYLRIFAFHLTAQFFWSYSRFSQVPKSPQNHASCGSNKQLCKRCVWGIQANMKISLKNRVYQYSQTNQTRLFAILYCWHYQHLSYVSVISVPVIFWGRPWDKNMSFGRYRNWNRNWYRNTDTGIVLYIHHLGRLPVSMCTVY